MNLDKISVLLQNDNYELVTDIKDYCSTIKHIPLESLKYGYGVKDNILVYIDLDKIGYTLEKNKSISVKLLPGTDAINGAVLLENAIEKDIVDIKKVLIYLIEFNNHYIRFSENKIHNIEIIGILEHKTTKLPLFLISYKLNCKQEIEAINPLVILYLTSAWQYA